MTDPALTIERLGEELALSFDYHPRRVAAIKRLPRRAWSPETRAWHVPLALVPDLIVLLEADEAPASWLEALRPHAGEALAKRAEDQVALARAAARALDAEAYPGLFAHQHEGVAFLLSASGCRGAILADEMGLGKTRQAIVAADAGSPEGGFLIVCPAALKLNWAREIRLALGPGQDVAVVQGQRFRRARWTIVNYDLLKRHHAALMAEPWACLILDEAHYLKNLEAQRTALVIGGTPRRGRARAGGLVSGLADRARRVIALTGTPITNKPLDLFPLLKAIGHPLGEDLLAYGLRYCAGFRGEWGWDFGGASHLDELHATLAPVLLRRRREDVLDLPPKLRTYMPVEVDLVAYRQVWRDYLAKLAERRKKGRGRRVPKRFLLAEVAKLRHAAALAKIPAALALVEQIVASDEKVVVFTGYHAVVSALMRRFGAAAVRLTGRDTAPARAEAVERFQHDPGVRVFVGNLQAAGVGLSLTAASQVVFVDYALVPADHLQAEDRPCRIGQRRAVTITYLSAQDTIDEEIEQLLAQKLGVVAAAIEGGSSGLAGSFVDDLLAVVARRGEAERTLGS